MDWGFWLTFIGLFLTVVFGIWGVYLAKRTRYPGRLTIILDDAIPLFETIVRGVPDLAITFRGAAIKPDLVLFKLKVVNSGALDIVPAMVEDNLSIHLPAGFDCLNATITASSPKLDASVSCAGNSITVQTGLFRQTEILGIDVLAAGPFERRSRLGLVEFLAPQVRSTHRIANVGTSPAAELRAGSWTEVIAFVAALLIVSGVLTFVISEYYRRAPSALEFLTIHNGQRSWVTVRAKGAGIRVMEREKRWSKVVQPPELQVIGVRTAPVYVSSGEFILLACLSIGVPVLIISILSESLYRRHRIRKLLKRLDLTSRAA